VHRTTHHLGGDERQPRIDFTKLDFGFDFPDKFSYIIIKTSVYMILLD
jgi:hypothetical protein